MTREEATIQALRNHIEVLEENIRALEQNTVSFDFELYQAGLMEMPKGVIDMLDEIRAEIDEEADYAYADFDRYKEDILHAEFDELPDDDFRYGLRRAIEIIDKYKAESEDKE